MNKLMQEEFEEHLVKNHSYQQYKPEYTGPGSSMYDCPHCDDQPGGCVECYSSTKDDSE